MGQITDSSATIWLQVPDLTPDVVRPISIALYETPNDSSPVVQKSLDLSFENFGAGAAVFTDLSPDTLYFYRLWHDTAASKPVDLSGLDLTDLWFRTLPKNGFGDQLDFLLMSCHNPGTMTSDGQYGFAVWATIPEIARENKNVRFALLAGDQVYADEIEARVLIEEDPRKRQELYLQVYRKFWGALPYRKVLASLPAFMMWDDHDITDGWGSREDSFTTKDSTEFRPEWIRLFETAKAVFTRMQATRNPAPISPDFVRGFDFCFKIGQAGFIMPDLRTNRNVRKGQLWLPDQLKAVKEWVKLNREELGTLFFVSPVVFSHGAPSVEAGIISYMPWILNKVHDLKKKWPLLKPLLSKFDQNIGDLRDDINDSWGAEVNGAETDRVLDFLFSLQNPENGKPINILILSGDIHAAGYSTIYSADANHATRAAIPHIVSSPVSYKPFSWIGEALFRFLSASVPLGKKGTYYAQSSHHFCQRNVAVLSLRTPSSGESQLKAKYYVEGYPEPQIMLFDLIRGSHRENITWPTKKVPAAATR